MINPLLKNATQRTKEHFYPNYYSKLYQHIRREVIGNLTGIRVLELGCGSGWLAREMQKSGFKVVAFDYSEKSLKESQFIYASENLDISLIRGDGRDLPFKDNSFDSVSMLGVLEHIVPPEASLKEIYRVMNKGGVFCVSVPNTFTYGVIYDRIVSPVFNLTPLGYDNVLNRHFSKIGLKRTHEPSDDHSVQFTANSFRRLLEGTSFRIIKFTNYDVFSSYAASLFCGLLRINRKLINPLEEIDIKLARKLPFWMGTGWLAICRKE